MFRPTFDLYLQSFPGRLVVEDLATGKRQDVTGEGFDHPRILIGDYKAAEAALRNAIAQVAPSRLHRVGRVLFHIRHEWASGLSAVEIRSVYDLVIGSAGMIRSLNVYENLSALSPADVQRLLRAESRSEPGLIG